MDFATEEAIKVEMRNWSAHALEIPNEYYNNMPACPYAKKAWATDKVGFSFKYDQDWQTLYTLISTWDDSKDVVILIDFCPLPLDEMDEYLDKINHAISQGMFINKDMFLMGFHPEDEGNELLDNEFESTVETPYGMVFLQRLSKLQEASDALRLKGYYKIAQQYYDADFLYKQRKDFYRRLKSEKS
tara:strand:+ start:204 stop:764 length:561 start_codon:yes stop_codon:yes gene_type:complete